MGTADTRRRGVRVLLPLALGIAAVLALGPVAAGAATVSAAWSAKIGSAGVNGKATISAYTTGTGAITLRLAKLRASTLHPVVLHKGTCSSVGAVLLTLPSIRTTSSGTAARTSSLTAGQISRITAATTAGKIAIRIGTGSARKCGAFSQIAPLPQRVTITSAMTLSSLKGHSYGTFVAAGPAVTSHLICPTGEVRDVYLNEIEGGWDVVKAFVCADGSQTFIVRLLVKVNDNGETFTWTVTGGSGPYRDLSGGGSGTSTPWVNGQLTNTYTGTLVGG